MSEIGPQFLSMIRISKHHVDFSFDAMGNLQIYGNVSVMLGEREFLFIKDGIVKDLNFMNEIIEKSCRNWKFLDDNLFFSIDNYKLKIFQDGNMNEAAFFVFGKFNGSVPG